MAPSSIISGGDDGSAEEEEVQPQAHHHPYAPPHELFDISTTVDPSYIISLIRKLLPLENSNPSLGSQVHDSQGSRTENGARITVSPFNGGELQPCAGSENEVRDAVENIVEAHCLPGLTEDVLQHQQKHQTISGGEAAWEEHGCTLWDLAANETHAELMVENLILEVLLANLIVSQSARITEISLGIIGNLACHEVSRKKIGSTNGLIKTIMDQLFLDDVPCLCEALRLITLCFQGGEGIIWREALTPEHILSRILWISENTLNLQLIEKSVGLLLAILASEREVATVLLPPLMKLCLPSLLINLFAFEMSKLTEERMPKRYPVLDIILQAIEALSATNDFSSYICSNKELFKLLNDLIKLPDKIEVSSSCVTAAVLVANILTDFEYLASEISQDSGFLQGIFDIIPFAYDDMEAKSALWRILERLLICIEVGELNKSSLRPYVSILVNKSDTIEEELVDIQVHDASEEDETFTNVANRNARTRVLRRISDILKQWKFLKAQVKEASLLEDSFVNEADVDKLLNYCCKCLECDKTSSFV
ncbi:hypothetical protein ACH5RR_021062 [Cinchona calisaya]|uniref:ARM repeat superfamily protein n=1 Tax=Cinchona calisaya TaxID=153742 RepID=A0ABD2ZGD8_9GENT